MKVIRAAYWSPQKSQEICGLSPEGDFVSAGPAFFHSQHNTYVLPDGELVEIISWKPDGFGYVDKRR